MGKITKEKEDKFNCINIKIAPKKPRQRNFVKVNPFIHLYYIHLCYLLGEAGDTGMNKISALQEFPLQEIVEALLIKRLNTIPPPLTYESCSWEYTLRK